VGLTQHKSAVRRQLADACGELTIIAVADALLHVERMQPDDAGASTVTLSCADVMAGEGTGSTAA